MNKKIVILVIVVIITVLLLFLVYANNDSSSNSNRTILNVSSEGPIELSKITDDIKNNSYYEGYDVETLRWMESLGDKYVFTSNDEIVIMDKWDADKIPSAYVCDAYFQEIFTCNVLENRTLGDGNHFKDVLFIKNVEFIDEEVHYIQI